MSAPTPQTLARIVRLVVLAFLAYVVLHVLTAPKKPAVIPAPKSSTAQPVQSGDCSGTAFSNFSMLAFPVFPSYSPALRIEDEKEGAGIGAACGQNAELTYSYTTLNKTPVFSNLEGGVPAETVRIGGTDLLPGAEHALIGMKAGGVRSVAMPGTLGFAGVKDIHALKDNGAFKFAPAGDPIVAKVSLRKLSPDVPSSPMPLRFLNVVFGGGEPVNCGDMVRADITAWKLDGTKVYSTDESPLIFTLGSGALPFGIEQGIIGMRAGGIRTLILPPALAHPFNSTPTTQPVNMNLPTDQVVLVEVKLEPMSAEDMKKATQAVPVPKK